MLAAARDADATEMITDTGRRSRSPGPRTPARQTETPRGTQQAVVTQPGVRSGRLVVVITRSGPAATAPTTSCAAATGRKPLLRPSRLGTSPARARPMTRWQASCTKSRRRLVDMTARSTRRWRTTAIVLVVGVLAGCTGGGGSDDADTNDPFGDPGDCTVIDVAVSSEKIDLMTDLAKSFNGSSESKIGDGCAFVRPYSKASGGAAALLADGWDEATEGPKPVIWSPAASSWGQILNQRLADNGAPMASSDSVSFMLTPLVIGMPKPMADALGYPETPIGWEDIARLATSGGLGGLRAPRVGRLQARQDQPQLLHQRPQRPGRPELRGHRQEPGPVARGPRRPGHQGLRHPGRVVGGALRRHHDDVPQQLVPHRSQRHLAALRVGRGRRGEVGDRLQQGQPRRRARARASSPASRRSRWWRSTRRRARSTATAPSTCSTPTG